jgi:hypothetical protein
MGVMVKVIVVAFVVFAIIGLLGRVALKTRQAWREGLGRDDP